VCQCSHVVNFSNRFVDANKIEFIREPMTIEEGYLSIALPSRGCMNMKLRTSRSREHHHAQEIGKRESGKADKPHKPNNSRCKVLHHHKTCPYRWIEQLGTIGRQRFATNTGLNGFTPQLIRGLLNSNGTMLSNMCPRFKTNALASRSNVAALTRNTNAKRYVEGRHTSECKA